MKRKPVYILCIFAAIAVLIYMTGESYYSGITKKAGLEKKEEKASSKSKDEPNPNLIQIFNEGFHVCHLHYAERLQDGENCLDCLELLYR